jgi:hypothetical protein
VQFSSGAYSADEGVGTTPITVTLSGVSGITVTVDYAASDLTAAGGSDYTATNGTLIFAPGQVSQSFLVTITNETPALDEPDETIRLALSNPSNATAGTPFTATLTIIDDDTSTGQCAGVYPSGEPNIGPPNDDPNDSLDNNFTSARIACGVGMTLDLGTTITTGHPGPDLIYHEMQGVAGVDPPPPPYYIYMDLIQVQIGSTPGGPWFTVFEWGDGIVDTNTNIGATYPDGGASSDNLKIDNPPLIGPAGIQIDVDNLPPGLPSLPAGSYQYIRLFSPTSGGPGTDGPEVDSIEIVP